MQDKIIFLSTGNEVDSVATARFTDRINGEMTLSFRTKTARVSSAARGDKISLGNKIFIINSINKSASGGTFLSDVSAEHISLSLADEKYDLESFNFFLNGSEILGRILDGTEFSGEVESGLDKMVGIYHDGSINRRALLNELSAALGGEIEYDGYNIRIVSHRGKSERYNICEKHLISEFSVSETPDALNYEIIADKLGEIEIGDEVLIPAGMISSTSAEVRVIALSYNPYYRKNVSVELGEYRPDITDEIVNDREDTESDMQKYLLSSELSARITSYINTEEGRGNLISALEGSFITEDSLNGYVTESELGTEIGQYIDGKEGKAKIISAVSGTYATKNEISGFVTETEVSTKITQEVSEGLASITLSASNGSESSTIYLYSNGVLIDSASISFTGVVTFNDLKNEGSTEINGANIITGTISADAVNTENLTVQKVYFDKSSGRDQLILTSEEVSGVNLSIKLGIQNDTGWLQALELYGTRIYFISPGYFGSEDHTLMFDMWNELFLPGRKNHWNIGSEDYYFFGVFAHYYYFHNGAYMYANNSGIRVIDPDGNTHYLVDF